MPRKSEYKVPEDPEGDVDPQIEASRKYRESDKGKASIKRDGSSDSHVRAQLKYSRSPKGKEAVTRWRTSDKGRLYREKQSEERARALLMIRREEDNLCGLCGSADHAMNYHIDGAQKG